ncbi:LOW QUALITY PROTEIN: hypothetical protein HJC23_013555, partial [Cyclotella cryptica]
MSLLSSTLFSLRSLPVNIPGLSPSGGLSSWIRQILPHLTSSTIIFPILILILIVFIALIGHPGMVFPQRHFHPVPSNRHVPPNGVARLERMIPPRTYHHDLSSKKQNYPQPFPLLFLHSNFFLLLLLLQQTQLPRLHHQLLLPPLQLFHLLSFHPFPHLRR